MAVVLDQRDRRRPTRCDAHVLRAHQNVDRAVDLGVEGHRADDRVGLGASSPARQEVGVADEAGHPWGGGPPVEVGRCADLLHDAVVDDGHDVAQHERLLLIMGHEEGRDRGVGEQAVDIGANLDAQRRVEVGERFVEQQHLGPGGERPGEGHPLLLTPRERARVTVGERRQADHVEHLAHSGGAALRPAQPEADVGGDGHLWEQRPVLEHHPHPPLFGGDPGAVGVAEHPLPDRDPALIGTFETGDRPKQGGLARTARTEQGADLSRLHDQRHPAQHLGGAEALGHVGDGE